MSLRIRGQEVTVRVSVDGQLYNNGSMIKLQDWTATERSDINEIPTLGEQEDELDYQFHGWDLSWSVHEEDAQAMELMQGIIARSSSGETLPNVTITVLKAYRGNNGNKVEIYNNVRMKMDNNAAGGRKEYLVTQFTAKAKKQQLLDA